MARKIHFIGCEGVSMRMLRAIATSRGFATSGSDVALMGHDKNFVGDADLVVYTAAIDAHNPELVYAKQQGIATITRGEYLGEVCASYPQSIAVSGAHGKTTTTAMLWEILRAYEPTVHIGGIYRGECGCVGGDLFITEACEYKRSFLSLKPDIAIILNVDLDHTDCYKNLEDMGDAFRTFARQAKSVVITNESFVVDDTSARVLVVGMNRKCDYSASRLEASALGFYSFDVYNKERLLGRIELSVQGRHNVYNSLFAIAAAQELGADFSCIALGLKRFVGAQRRMEFLGNVKGCAVFSDYAHHPGEITMSLSGVKEGAYKHITVVFEPHTYTRTKSFYNEFADALSLADCVVLLPVYAARELPQEGADSCLIAAALENKGRCAICLSSYAQAREYLIGNSVAGGVILFMGAGTIDTLAREFVLLEGRV